MRSAVIPLLFIALLGLSSWTACGSIPKQERFFPSVLNRGLLTNLVHGFATNTTGPDTKIIRFYNGYGYLNGESWRWAEIPIIAPRRIGMMPAGGPASTVR